jgi:uncharacterized protein (DUF2141 family)
MLKRILPFIILLITSLTLIQCAKKGTISGGIKDEIPPKLLKASPAQNSTNFKAKEIRLYFDEYVKLKDLNKNLIISPPLKHKPLISPQGTASKIVKIKIQDTFKDNTTYIFNFGQSIVDNNEGNPYPNFSYVFSTGNHIDSLTLKGTVQDALLLEDPKQITVMLYEIKANYTDSIIYKEKPDYLTNTLDTNVFNFSNLKAGKYRLIAIEDLNNNQKYNPKTEKIAFLKEPIILPDTLAKELKLFTAILPFKSLKAKEISKGKILFPFEGDSSGINIVLKNKLTANFSYFVQKIKEKDSLLFWHKNIKQDSVLLSLKKGAYQKEHLIKLRRKRQDTILIAVLNKGTLAFNQKIQIASATALDSIDNTQIKLLDKDSIAVVFNTKIATNKDTFTIEYPLKENQKYKLEILPNAIIDFFGNSNKDTIKSFFITKKISDYGTLKLQLENKKAPVFVQLLNSRTAKVTKTIYLEKGDNLAFFNNLTPTTYLVRILVDKNNNGKWDSGNIMSQTYPEKVIYLPKPLEVRANWDLEETFVLD